MQAKMRKNIDKSKKCVIVKHKSKKIAKWGKYVIYAIKRSFQTP